MQNLDSSGAAGEVRPVSRRGALAGQETTITALGTGRSDQ